METSNPTVYFPQQPATDSGGERYQQDRACISVLKRTVGIFDGHGDYGAEAAEAAARYVASAPAESPFDLMFESAEVYIKEAIRQKVNRVHGENPKDNQGVFYIRNLRTRRVEPCDGGTTASVVRFGLDGSLSIANVGDSDVVVFNGPNNIARSVIASHHPTTQSEWERVHAAHPATVFKFQNSSGDRSPEQPVWKQEQGEWVMGSGKSYTDVRNSWAAYVAHPSITSTLAMTRSLGDFQFKRHGVISTPDVTLVPPPKPGTTRVVVAGSDGVWDALRYDEVRDLVYRPDLVGNADLATQALLELALTAAHRHFGAVVDNLICVVTYVVAPSRKTRRPRASAAVRATFTSGDENLPLAVPVVPRKKSSKPRKPKQAQTPMKTKKTKKTNTQKRTSQKTRRKKSKQPPRTP